MQDMGVEPYLITSAVNGVLSQRLVRTLCEHCKQAHDPGPEIRQRPGLARFFAAPPPVYHAPGPEMRQRTGRARFCAAGQPVSRAVGCEHCRQSGYRGRTGIHELLLLDDSLRRAIIEGRDANILHAMAVQGGMLSLYEDGLRKVAAGRTTLDELARVTQDDPSDA